MTTLATLPLSLDEAQADKLDAAPVDFEELAALPPKERTIKFIGTFYISTEGPDGRYYVGTKGSGGSWTLVWLSDATQQPAKTYLFSWKVYGVALLPTLGPYPTFLLAMRPGVADGASGVSAKGWIKAIGEPSKRFSRKLGFAGATVAQQNQTVNAFATRFAFDWIRTSITGEAGKHVRSGLLVQYGSGWPLGLDPSSGARVTANPDVAPVLTLSPQKLSTPG